MQCTLPSCKPYGGRHTHFFKNEPCKFGRHAECTGAFLTWVKMPMDDLQAVWWASRIVDRHVGITSNYWKGNELFKDTYHESVKVREGRRNVPLGLKVWTCKCDCHERRGLYTVWSAVHGHRGFRVFPRRKEITAETIQELKGVKNDEEDQSQESS